MMAPDPRPEGGRMRRWVGALALALVGCHGGSAGPPTALPDAATLAMVDAAGDRALAVVVLRPDAWAALHQALAPLAATLPGGGKAAFERATDPGALLPPEGSPVNGWDRTRPVVLALGEATRSGPPGTLAPTLDATPGALRHRALIPATDPVALTARLAAAAEALGAKPDAAVGSHGYRLGDDTVVALFPEEKRVRVEVAVGAPTSLDAPTGKPAHTPALLAAATGAEGVAVVFRPWHLRAVSTWYGHRKVDQALANVDVSNLQAIRLQGLAELLTGELLMDDEGAEMDDRLLAIGAEGGGVRVRSVSSLTPAGAAILEAGESGAAAPLPLQRDVLAAFTVRLDARAAVDKASVPPGLSDGKKLRDLTRQFMEGGPATSMHAAERTPFGLVHRLLDLAGDAKLQGISPRCVQVAIVDLADPSPVAVAVVLKSDAEADALRALLKDLPEGMTLDVAHRGSDVVALFGMAVDPKTVFATDKSADDKALASGFIRLDAVQMPLGWLTPALKAAKRIDFLGARAGRTIDGVVRVAMSGPTDALTLPALPAAEDWPSPMGGSPATKGGPCLRNMARSFAKGMQSMNFVDPAQKAAFTAAALTDVHAELACATDDPATRPAAEALRGTLLDAAYDEGDAAWAPERAGPAAQLACTVGDAARCERWKAIAARPPLPLPKLKTRCDIESRPVPGLHLVLGSAVTLDGKALSAPDAPALAEAPKGGAVQLAVPPETPFATVAPWLAALRRAGADQVLLTARAPDGGLVRVPLRLVERRPAVPQGIGGIGTHAGVIRALARTDDTPPLEPTPDTPWAAVAEAAALACPDAALAP
jgi:hypothetical protein